MFSHIITMFGIAVALNAQTGEKATIQRLGSYTEYRAKLDRIARESDTLEKKQDWAGALSEYKQATESPELRLNSTPNGHLLAGTAYLDSARMLAQLGRQSDPEYMNNLNSAEQLLRMAADAPPALKSVAYNNLALVASLKGNLAQSVDYFDASSKLNPDFATARISAQKLAALLQAQPELKKRQGAYSERSRKLVDLAIDVGVLFAKRDYPIAGSIIGMTLKYINGEMLQPAR